MNVSVVIPCKDMWDTAYAAAESAYEAGSRDIQIINDHSATYVDSGRGEFPFGYATRFEVRHLPDYLRGVVCARNVGIFHAVYELVVPLDADDTLLPDGLKLLTDAWEPGTLVYGGWLENGDYRSPPPPEMLSRKNVAHATWLFHKVDWRRVGGHDPDLNIGGEDWGFMVALVAAGVRPVRVDVPIYRRAIHSGSRTDQARSRIHFIRQLLVEKYPAVMMP